MKLTFFQAIAGIIVIAVVIVSLILVQPPPLLAPVPAPFSMVSVTTPTTTVSITTSIPEVVYTHTYTMPVAAGIVSVESLINAARQARGVDLLQDSATLDHVAQFKADDMVKGGYFDHVSPSGKRISRYDASTDTFYWIDGTVNTYSYVGENLGEGFADAQSQQQAWLNSPTHLANIIKPQYGYVGVGVATGVCRQQDTCKGDYGREVTFTVTVFAK